MSEDDWQEPELTCPHIDAAIASGELSEAVKAELNAIREINSQLRYGTWVLRAQLADHRATQPVPLPDVGGMLSRLAPNVLMERNNTG